jgi:hypothetical protein
MNTQLGSDNAEQINKTICDFVFESQESQIFLQSFYKDYNRKPVQRVLNYALDPSKTDYCNDVDAIKKAVLWLLKIDDISHDEYMCKILELYDGGVEITTKHLAEDFVKILRKNKL